MKEEQNKKSGRDKFIEELEKKGLIKTADFKKKAVDERQVLFNIYKTALKIVGTEVDEKVEEKLWFYLNTKTDTAVEKRTLFLNDIERGMYERTRLYAMMMFEKDRIKWLGERLTSVLDATSDENIADEKYIEINGNMFIYNENEIDIDQYRDVLENIGSSVKDETMYVYLDDGELVVY